MRILLEQIQPRANNSVCPFTLSIIRSSLRRSRWPVPRANIPNSIRVRSDSRRWLNRRRCGCSIDDLSIKDTEGLLVEPLIKICALETFYFHLCAGMPEIRRSTHARKIRANLAHFQPSMQCSFTTNPVWRSIHRSCVYTRTLYRVSSKSRLLGKVVIVLFDT